MSVSYPNQISHIFGKAIATFQPKLQSSNVHTSNNQKRRKKLLSIPYVRMIISGGGSSSRVEPSLAIVPN